MMYPFLTLDDGTEIVHSEMKEDGRVKVYVEKPDETDFFHNAVCRLLVAGLPVGGNQRFYRCGAFSI